MGVSSTLNQNVETKPSGRPHATASTALCQREIIQGADDGKTYARPMPANARAVLIEALRNARHWLDELLSDPRLTLKSIASRRTRASIRSG